MSTPARRRPEAGLVDYLKEAFLFRWNLLFLAGAAGVAAIGPAPDVFLPLVGAAELLYLAGLTSIPRFRAAIDAKVHAEGRPAVAASAGVEAARPLTELLAGLEEDSRTRFEHLRTRCLTMRGIARGVRGTAGAGEGDDIRTPALDRLLWVFLRLLSSEQALERFTATTDEDEIEARLEDLKAREAAARQRGDERILRSLTDSIATAEMRLENYRKAEGNLEFVRVELDRIEGKIQALSEMAVSHQDPDYISSQVDSVAESMAHTEKAIRELDHITGLTDELQGPPPILEADLEVG